MRRHTDEDRDTVLEAEDAIFQKAESFLNRWAENDFAKSLEQMVEAAMQPMVDRVQAEMSKLKARAGIVDKGTAPSVDVNDSRTSLGGRTLLSVARQPPEKSVEELLSEVETKSQAEALWRRSPAIREEFPAWTTLFHYCDANRKGRIHQQQKVAPQEIAIPDEMLMAITTPERATELWDTSPKIREEFDSRDQLWACAQAMQSGRARIFRADRAGVVK
jgi:hypothetical protein